MSVLQWPFKRKQYTGMDNPRYVSDIVAANEAVTDAIKYLSGLSDTDFAIISGFDESPQNTFSAGVFYLNGIFYYKSSQTLTGQRLVGTTQDTMSAVFPDSVTRNIYTLNTATTTTGGGGNSPVFVSGVMEQYRVNLKALRNRIVPLETKRMFGGTVGHLDDGIGGTGGVGVGILTTITHNKNIPVINQSINLTYSGRFYIGTQDYANMDAAFAGTHALASCNLTPNSFDIYAPLDTRERPVDWLLLDNR